MPVRIWEERDGALRSSILDSTGFDFRDFEAKRAPALKLDEQFDVLLDRALELLAEHDQESSASSSHEFVRAWCVGSAIRLSEVLKYEAFLSEPRWFAWKALYAKIEVGVRHDGERFDGWRILRPPIRAGVRRAGKRLDHFEMCMWLAEQSYDDAALVFGSSVRNVWQMLERRALTPIVVRDAIAREMRTLTSEEQHALTKRDAFATMMKQLRDRFPDRGPGSADRPDHYSADELAAQVVGPLIAALLAKSACASNGPSQ